MLISSFFLLSKQTECLESCFKFCLIFDDFQQQEYFQVMMKFIRPEVRIVVLTPQI